MGKKMDNLFFHDSDINLDTVEENQLTRKIKARGGKLMIVEVIFKEGAVGAEHQHPHEQIVYCLSGEFEFTIDGAKTHFLPGDSAYIPSSVKHGALCVREGRLLDIFTPQREDFLKK